MTRKLLIRIALTLFCCARTAQPQSIVFDQPPFPGGLCSHVILSTEGHYRAADDIMFPEDVICISVVFYPSEEPTDPGNPNNQYYLRIWEDNGSGQFPLDPPVFVSGPHHANDGIVSFHTEDTAPGGPDSVIALQFTFPSGFFTALAHHKYWIGMTGSPSPDIAEFGVCPANSPVPNTPLVQDAGNGWYVHLPHLDMALRLIGVTSSGRPLAIVHDHGLPGETQPFSGYIDPRRESTNGATINQGLTAALIKFNQNVDTCNVSDFGVANFIMRETGNGMPPAVTSATFFQGDHSYVQVSWNRPLTPQEWTTIQAVNLCGTDGILANFGDLGDQDEPDRIDIGFLPADVNQDGIVTPVDLLRWRQLFNFIVSPALGTRADLIDTDRNGSIMPGDLLFFKRLIHGVSPATQEWAGQRMNHPRP